MGHVTCAQICIKGLILAAIPILKTFEAKISSLRTDARPKNLTKRPSFGRNYKLELFQKHPRIHELNKPRALDMLMSG